MVINYNMAASRELIAALQQAFGDQRFDEYAVAVRRDLPLEFLHDRKRTTRISVAHWLRWAVDQNIGLTRDPNNPTWFRVLAGRPPGRGITERDSRLIVK